MKLNFSRLAGLVTLSMGLPVSADTIYSGLLDTSIPTDFTGVTVSINGGTINPFFGGVGVANNNLLQPLRDGTGNLDTLLNLSSGTVINAGSQYLSTGFGGSQDHLGSNFSAGQEGYIGFKLNGADYGWIRVVFTNNTGGALIRDWAYDNSAGSIATGNVLQDGSTVTLNSDLGSFTLGSQLTGSNNVVKTGSNTVTLANSSNYSGTTTVSSGVLAVNGQLANTSTTVASGGTLRGIGSIGGTVTVQSGGTIAAGNSIESLATGALGLEAGSTFAYELDNDAAATVAGDLTAVSGDLTLDLSNAAILTLNDLGGGSWSAGDKLTLISYSGSWNTGLFSYLGGTLADDSTFTFNSMLWKFDYNDGSPGTNYSGDLTGSSFVTMTAIPEPRAALLGGFGLLALLRRRRRD